MHSQIKRKGNVRNVERYSECRAGCPCVTCNFKDRQVSLLFLCRHHPQSKRQFQALGCSRPSVARSRFLLLLLLLLVGFPVHKYSGRRCLLSSNTTFDRYLCCKTHRSPLSAHSPVYVLRRPSPPLTALNCNHVSFGDWDTNSTSLSHNDALHYHLARNLRSPYVPFLAIQIL